MEALGVTVILVARTGDVHNPATKFGVPLNNEITLHLGGFGERIRTMFSILDLALATNERGLGMGHALIE